MVLHEVDRLENVFCELSEHSMLHLDLGCFAVGSGSFRCNCGGRTKAAVAGFRRSEVLLELSDHLFDHLVCGEERKHVLYTVRQGGDLTLVHERIQSRGQLCVVFFLTPEPQLGHLVSAAVDERGTCGRRLL